MSRPAPNRSYPSAFDPTVPPEVMEERLKRHYRLCLGCKWDSTRCLNDPQYCADYVEIERPKNERLWLLLSIAFVIILILLMGYRILDTKRGTVIDGDSGEISRSVERLDAPIYEGAVAVWLEPGAKIEDALASVGLAGAETIFSSSDGKYIVTVDPGSEQVQAANLRRGTGVAAAGFVYQQ